MVTFQQFRMSEMRFINDRQVLFQEHQKIFKTLHTFYSHHSHHKLIKIEYSFNFKKTLIKKEKISIIELKDHVPAREALIDM